MSSLMQSVLTVVQPPGTQMTEEECLASFDLDANEIANIDGGWDPICIVNADLTSHSIKSEQCSLSAREFVVDGPSVYERDGYMIIRGTHMGESPVWFVFESSNTGVH